MKKILISVLLILLISILMLVFLKGVDLKVVQILAIRQIQTKNSNLEQEIDTANQKVNLYDTTVKKLSTSVNELTNTKKKYLSLINERSDSDIKNATQTRSYSIEYLWSRIGNHATKEGVNLKFEPSSSMSGAAYKDLKFTVRGNYLAISNFVTEIENDSELSFTIDSFKLSPTAEGTTGGLEGTFLVKDVAIKTENVSYTPPSANANTNSTNTNTTSTNTSQ